jgi:hypothetical protein
MGELTTGVHWAAALLGTVLAFGLGMLRFSPRMFGRIWAAGSHDLKPPASLPLAAMAAQLLGTFLMAWVIGVTETGNLLMTAILLILAIASLVFSMDLFSQKTKGAALVDGGYVVAMGVLMILAQAIL